MQAYSSIKKICQNKESFWDTWIKNKNSIFNACLMYTGSHYHDAQDLMSEVMFKAYNKTKKQGLIITDPQNWFMRIVQNAYINRYNYNSRFVHYENLEDAFEGNNNFARSPYKEMLGREIQKELNSGLQKLPPYQGHLARLYFDGNSYKSIAKNYGISTDNIRKIVQLSRQSLQQDIHNYRLCLNDPKQTSEEELYGHIIKVKKDGLIHYKTFYNSIAPHRLKQKISGLKNYLNKSPYAGEKRLELAELLVSNSQIDEALQQINLLLSENFYNEKLYDLKIRSLILQNKFTEVFETTIEACKNLPLPPSKFQVWKLQAQLRYKDAEDFLKLQIRQEPVNLSSRSLLVDSYLIKGETKNAFDECQNIQRYEQYHLESLPSCILGKLKFESYKSAKKYAARFYQKHPKSILVSLYLLHFYLNEGLNLDNDKVNRLFQKIRKRYSWHPDFSLAKAQLPTLNKDKTLRRRCLDYPDCVLSKHYLNKFSSLRCDLNKLNHQEQCHLEILSLIYRR